MELFEKTLSSQEIFQGRILKLRVDQVELPDGRQSRREVIEHSGGVTIIPITRDNKIIMVEQYRKPAERSLLELPAGKLEENEEPLACAARELEEETGFQAQEIKYLFSFYTSPGYSNEIIHLFQAEDLRQVGVNPDADENIKLHFIEQNNILDYIYSGKIVDGKTIIGLMTLLRGKN